MKRRVGEVSPRLSSGELVELVERVGLVEAGVTERDYRRALRRLHIYALRDRWRFGVPS